MASPIKLSPYKMGPLRFGTRPYKETWDTSVKTTKLTQDELEQYKAGKSIDEILRERENMPVKKLPITIEQYVELKLQNKKEKEIAAELGLTEQQLWSWKHSRKEKIAKALEIAQNEQKDVPDTYSTRGVEKRENELKSAEKPVSEIEELKKEIENLKKEVIDAHKQITEWQEKYYELDDQFNYTLQAKDQALKMNANLENQLHEQSKEIIRLNEEINLLNKEIYPLRQLTYLKLSREVNLA